MKRRIDMTALVIAIVGAVNWGMHGLFSFDVVSWFFGGQSAVGSRIIYVMVVMAGLWCINLVAVQGRRSDDVHADLTS